MALSGRLVLRGLIGRGDGDLRGNAGGTRGDDGSIVEMVGVVGWRVVATLMLMMERGRVGDGWHMHTRHVLSQ